MRKHILIFTYSLGVGGTEKFISLLLNSPQLKNCQIDVLLFYDLVDYEFSDNVHVEYIFENKIRYSLLHKCKLLLYGWIKLKRRATSQSYCGIIGFGTIPGILVGILKRVNNNFQVTINIRTQLFSKHRQGIIAKLYTCLQKWAFRGVDLIVCNSEKIKQDLCKKHLLTNPIVNIPNALDVCVIKKRALEFVPQKFSRPTIVTVGRLIFAKGHWHLIRAFSYVQRQIPNAHLVIIGEGELRQYLESLVVDLRLQANVSFLGFQKNPFPYIYNSNVFALSSLWEGLPNVLLETIVCNVPIVAADCISGPREILAPGTVYQNICEPLETPYGILSPAFDGVFYSANAPLTKAETLFAQTTIRMIQEGKSFTADLPSKFYATEALRDYTNAVFPE